MANNMGLHEAREVLENCESRDIGEALETAEFFLRHLENHMEDFCRILCLSAQYSCGSTTYMPDMTCQYLSRILQYLPDQAICDLEKTIRAKGTLYGYGDPRADRPTWMAMLDRLEREKMVRGFKALQSVFCEQQ